ncbi:MAG: pantetheine-phosphate adenylyltransferase [Aphanocapsa feldmannii 277cV]|uniref:Phosphopantetheine adenylyltransferase n=2 Tax=Aphanocapsa feldmannii TaxID=192050 RepID=A0A524RL51_9CHRO|nr:MAG: pantetheine-phosphate adenylyltransferase [Aphanocapsa feldmannii 277cV]TGH25615.1 MAG: pantetheine-phosphate adenylyltransferase [Aphanocapsa feldmannii 277cI]
MRALYPGSFDPVTLGHLDLIERSHGLFAEVVVAVLRNPNKQPLFELEQRISQLRGATAHLPRVRIASFAGLAVNFARHEGCSVILRGLRALSDFEFELQLAHTNRSLCQDVETFFLATGAHHSFLSSSVVKEVARFGGDISHMVPAKVAQDLRNLFNQASERHASHGPATHRGT